MLITVTLLAFVVLLLIGLAAYTRIETAIAGNTQRQAQARENALFALNVAVGQLQKHAGPDQRVTATAEAFGGGANTRRFTGVWTTDATADPDGDPLTPLTWLVSGNEPLNADGTPVNPLAIAPGALSGNTVQLVGARTAGNGNTNEFISVPLQDIRTAGVPGIAATAAPAVVGRYGWWVGDQGVKAPVAIGDPTTVAANYSSNPSDPFSSAEIRSRIRQQIALGAGAINTTTSAPEFEPRDTTGGSTSNATLVSRIVATSQIAFLKNTASTPTAVGLATLQRNFAAWSPNNFAVFANTKLGGLRQDLSIQPDLLGQAFSAWANYQDYMEVPSRSAKPGQTASITFADDADSPFPAMLQNYGDDPIRRRYVLRGESSSYRIAPVLSFFGLSFSVRNNPTAAALEVSARCVVGLWNPYTSAFVPEDLQIVVRGLPNRVNVHDSVSINHQHVDLEAVMADQASGGPLKLYLPFTPDAKNDDRSSWLPGRVYSWAAESNTADAANGRGKPMAFYERAAAQPGSGIVRVTPEPPLPVSTSAARVTRWCRVGSPTILVIELLRASTGEKLAEFESPAFAEFETDQTRLDTNDQLLDFAFIFRLPEGPEIPVGETEPWLRAAGRDPRQSPFPSRGYVAPGFGIGPDGRPNPALLVQTRTTTFDASYPDRLLDRAPNETSFDGDTPVFELPRAPLLSVGQLQHLGISGERPFAIGNSGIGGAQLNGIPASELFDRFFFSGLSTGVEPMTVNNALLLPNPLIRVLRDPITNLPATLSDLQGTTSAHSSRLLLQGGAFNINSTSMAAWAALLRSTRLVTASPVKFLAAEFASGTANDDNPKDLPRAAADTESQQTDPANGDALFSRFSQSAQETYKVSDPKGSVTYAASTVKAPLDPDPPSAANTHLFRTGLRKLTGAQVTLLAAKIAEAVKARHIASGPFLSLEEFLAPSSPGNPSLIEQAIIDADNAGGQINVDASGNPIEFSSQYLTQADIMTALAPVLFARSDTFVVRAYGEAVNPMTNTTEGRAWCEAVVQRLPEYFDPSAATGDAAEVAPAALVSALNQTYGRRFKVVSFRWLTRSDI
ncbi:MAG: hypothetical protein HZA93_14340 [Verrucomicrobia bacterium]|nr:hypothetical protein [Verrucomicrobiota bacterium]